MRKLYYTKEFTEFFESAEDRVRNKVIYLSEILINQRIINQKIAKKLKGTELYELRIQVGNEYRVLLFTIDSEDLNQSENVLYLSAFQKKSTKDYKKQITKATKILEQWQEQE